MQCGFYETEITPPLGTMIPGYFTKRVNQGVKQKLYAKAAVLENEGKTVAVLVVDAVTVQEEMPAFVRKRVHEKTGIAEDAILITATHSHTGIPTQRDKGVYKNIQILDNEPELNPELDGKTIDQTLLLATDAVVMAYQRLEEVNISFGIGEAKNLSYVRQYYLEDGTVRTNPGYCKEQVVKSYSEPDPALPVLFFTNKEGKPVGSMASFALHHDTVSGFEVSSDYSGVVSKKLKQKYGNDFVSIFFSGFCGNINHLDYVGEKQGKPFKKTTREIGEALTEEMLKTIEKAKPVLQNSLQVKMETVKIKKRELPEGFVESVKELVKNPPPKTAPMTIADPYSDRMKYAASGALISYYDENKKTEFDIPVQVIKIGDCLIYALVGEVFSQFADKIRAKSPTEKNMMVEFANYTDHPYIPIKEMFLPFVYESSYFRARLEPDAGDKMVNKALEIAQEIY